MTVTVMVGLPASGKSTYARMFAAQTNAHICSSDAIREKLYGDEAKQGNPAEVFKALYKEMREHLAAHESVILDATNVSSLNRKEIFRNLRWFKSYTTVHAVVMDTPLETCLRRAKMRERFIPDDVFANMQARFEMPTLAEGFDEIQIIRANDNQGKE